MEIRKKGLLNEVCLNSESFGNIIEYLKGVKNMQQISQNGYLFYILPSGGHLKVDIKQNRISFTDGARDFVKSIGGVIN